MTRHWITLLSLFLIISLNTTWANIEVRQFPNKDQEVLYLELISELRCLVCQNDTLATSNAEKAEDIRDEVFRMVTQKNMGKEAIKISLVRRYGNNVLYKPTEKELPWFYALILFTLPIIGFVILLLALRKNEQKRATVSDQSKTDKMK